jgi:hypothetical protein
MSLVLSTRINIVFRSWSVRVVTESDTAKLHTNLLIILPHMITVDFRCEFGRGRCISFKTLLMKAPNRFQRVCSFITSDMFFGLDIVYPCDLVAYR